MTRHIYATIRDAVELDSMKLHLCDLMERHHGRLEQAHNHTQRRIAENAKIAAAAARGEQIAVVWSGRDCDGVRYSNHVSMVEADRKVIDKHIEHTYEWADGPCNYRLVSSTDADALQYTSRDLTMEAFENGHAHRIFG